MSYATRADYEARYGTAELLQRETMLPAGAVAQALADADSTIDGYMLGRYAVPLSPVPSNLVTVACRHVRYAILGNAADDRARKDHEDAMAWLKDVASGKVSLPAATALAAVVQGDAKPVSRTTARQFDGDSLAAY